MKNYIKSVSIKGLWDVKNIEVILYEDVNILVGGNGSGKTTFLRIVESLLNVDLAAIEEIVFNEVDIAIQCEDVKVIHIERFMEDLITPAYRYVFPPGRYHTLSGKSPGPIESQELMLYWAWCSQM